MGRICAYRGCRSSTGLHRLPADPALLSQWRIRIGLNPDTKTSGLQVCNQHFSQHSFSNYMEVKMGYLPERYLKLKPDAVPNPADHLACWFKPKDCKDQACQTDPADLQGVCDQEDVKPPKTYDAGSLDASSVQAASETHLGPSIPLKRPKPEPEEFSILPDLTDSAFHPDHVTNGSTRCERNLPEAPPPQKRRNLVIYEENLNQLFRKCPVCSKSCEINTSAAGSLLHVTQRCPHCCCLFEWNSQPKYIQNLPAENLHPEAEGGGGEVQSEPSSSSSSDTVNMVVYVSVPSSHLLLLPPLKNPPL